MRVLLLEDDPELGPVLRQRLRGAGLAVDLVDRLADADLAVTVSRYDCLVLDRALPDGDGLDLVQRLRADGAGTPVLVLTAMDTIGDRVDGFERGADDYLVKPFAVAELVARIRALVRRAPSLRAPVLQAGDLDVDVARHRVTRAGVLLTLTAKEFAVLEVLAEHAGDVVTRTELVERCWDQELEPMSNVVDVLIGHLRRRLGEPDLVQTVRGVGYRLAADEAADDAEIGAP